MRAKRIAGFALPLLVVASLATLWVLQCSGPRPSVGDIEVIQPDQPGDPYRILATVTNERWGEGQVTVEFRLRDRQTGRVFETAQQVSLDGEGEVVAVAEIPAPPGEYEAEAEARFPPK